MRQTCIWSDEFDYEGPPDPEKWGFQTGGHGWGNNEAQFYTDRTGAGDANAYVSGGRLAVTVRREDYEGARFTSARLKSKASWLYGRIDILAKLPKGAGTWPAVWMLSDTIRERGWPDCGEIDIMEHVGRTQDVLHFSLHSGLYNHKNDTHRTLTRRCPGVSEAFHLYSVDWKEDEIAFLLDGETVALWRNGDGGRDTGPGGWPFNTPFFLILNVAFGGHFGGPPDEGCLPQTMEIQSVRVYQ